ncbi:hypothetical protein SAMN05421872_1103 [Nocardioides lianchengensis]|uniref:Uncharacterized protein n=1 Tax=Nocardioides lianchengensis TaxID=1045774 RepID=A0A1G6WMX8_9ACTN|nr:hypothetical protein [Nocardioides lianchengensis]SDD67208.1 hypothetical protein SAMN05421872_1103 [Nocardioides lianchengensis]
MATLALFDIRAGLDFPDADFCDIMDLTHMHHAGR